MTLVSVRVVFTLEGNSWSAWYHWPHEGLASSSPHHWHGTPSRFCSLGSGLSLIPQVQIQLPPLSSLRCASASLAPPSWHLLIDSPGRRGTGSQCLTESWGKPLCPADRGEWTMVNLLGPWHGQNRVNSIGRIWGKAGSKDAKDRTCTQVPDSDESEAGGCSAAELEKEHFPRGEKSYQVLPRQWFSSCWSSGPH